MIEHREIAVRSPTEDDGVFIESTYYQTQQWIIEKLFGRRGDDVERKRLAETCGQAATRIVAVNDQRAGRLTVNRRPNAIYLEHIYMSAAWQNDGIGTFLISQLVKEARTANIPVKLSTAKINPARRLYERLGFVAVSEGEYKVHMAVL
jgi:GNAT superfamily N-acetyltransferase